MTQSHDKHKYIVQHSTVHKKIVPWSCVNVLCVCMHKTVMNVLQTGTKMRFYSQQRREKTHKKQAPSPGSTALDLRVCVRVWFICLLFLSGSVIQFNRYILAAGSDLLMTV